MYTDGSIFCVFVGVFMMQQVSQSVSQSVSPYSVLTESFEAQVVGFITLYLPNIL